MGKFRLPSQGEVFGENRLEIFKKNGRQCESADLNGFLLDFSDYRYNWWLSTRRPDPALLSMKTYYVNRNGDCDYEWVKRPAYFAKIRPVMKCSPSDLSEIEPNFRIDDDGIIEVEYGEYPQKKVSEDLDDKLEDNYRNKRLKETGKKYTIELGYVDNNKEYVPPMQVIEYEFDKKKYVRLRRPSGRIIWLEVNPIVWYVDMTKKILISKKLLFNRIEYKDIPKFLNTYFAEEIIVKKPKKEEEKKTDTNEKKEDLVSSNEELSSIEKLINEIHKYLEGNPNGDAIIEKLVGMTNDYNEKLNKIEAIVEKNLPSLDTYDSVTAAFELELNMLLVEVKKHHAAFKEYFDMIAILDKYISLINGNEDKEYDDGFISDLDVINTICLPFLKEEDANKIRKQLINIFNDEKKEIINYIDNNNKLSYKTIDEMILDLRRKIHPVLENLSTSVNKRDVEVEIKTTVSKIIDGLFDKPKNEALSFYLVEINNVYTNINALIDKLPSDMKSEYKREILDIMNMEIDYTSEFNNIANDLKTMWLSLNKVLCRINGYLEKVEQIRSGHIDVNKIKR